jgi:hypothetical protein
LKATPNIVKPIFRGLSNKKIGDIKVAGGDKRSGK